MRIVSYSCCLPTAICCLLCLSGCTPGEELGQVSGRVAFQGKPVSPALIAFSNREKGVHVLADINADGTYRVVMAKGAGLPLGTYDVTINPPLVDVPLGPLMAPLPRNQKFENIPQRYRQADTTPLRLEVKAGENPFDVELTPG
jgi:hypothetical protein